MTPTEQTIHDYILKEIMYSDDPAELPPDRPLLKDGIIDSMDLQRLVSFLEQEFGILVSDDLLVPGSFENLRAVAAMVETVQKRN